VAAQVAHLEPWRGSLSMPELEFDVQTQHNFSSRPSNHSPNLMSSFTSTPRALGCSPARAPVNSSRGPGFDVNHTPDARYPAKHRLCRLFLHFIFEMQVEIHTWKSSYTRGNRFRGFFISTDVVILRCVECCQGHI
jgi:hypothetical protein